MYLRFMAKAGVHDVPGRDGPWKIQEVKAYLEWRAGSNNVRSLAQIKCMLKHCGLCYDYLLPTAKGEGPAGLRLQLAMVTKSIGKGERKQLASIGKSAAPKRSLGLGKVAVSLLFSAYSATTRSGFAALDRDTRHHLVTSVSMHTGCMRYELIRQLRKSGSFRWSQPDQCWRAASDWHKMKRRTDGYTVAFAWEPQFQAMVYDAYASDGSVEGTFTAAHILQWHMDIEESQEASDLFDPSDKSSAAFQKWLRASFRALLMEDAAEVEALVAAITPHSFRAGIAGDLERESVPRPRIKKLGRWSSDRAMEQYIRGGLAQRLQRLLFRFVTCSKGRVTTRGSKSIKVRTRSSDSSEGYDVSSESS